MAIQVISVLCYFLERLGHKKRVLFSMMFCVKGKTSVYKYLEAQRQQKLPTQPFCHQNRVGTGKERIENNGLGSASYYSGRGRRVEFSAVPPIFSVSHLICKIPAHTLCERITKRQDGGIAERVEYS